MNANKPYLPAIVANLTALRAILTPVMEELASGLKAAEQGNQNGAVGSIIPTEERLRQANILLQAIFVLHRQN
jgi:hypothetical protein